MAAIFVIEKEAPAMRPWSDYDEPRIFILRCPAGSVMESRSGKGMDSSVFSSGNHQ
jgi:hypothetical protein